MFVLLYFSDSYLCKRWTRLPAEFQSIRKLNEYDIAKEPIQLTRVTKLPAIAFMSIENIFANKQDIVSYKHEFLTYYWKMRALSRINFMVISYLWHDNPRNRSHSDWVCRIVCLFRKQGKNIAFPNFKDAVSEKLSIAVCKVDPLVVFPQGNLRMLDTDDPCNNVSYLVFLHWNTQNFKCFRYSNLCTNMP
jgi:hypothetical protein